MYERLSAFLLEKLGLRRINADHSIFISTAGLNGLIVSTFVDDIKIMGIKGGGFIERELAAAFSIVDMGPISFYLGLRVKRDHEKKTIKLSQPAYLDKVLEKFHLNKANASCQPHERNSSSHAKNGGRSLNLREGTISRHDRIADVLYGRNKAGRRLRNVGSEPFCKKSVSPVRLPGGIKGS